MTTKQIEPGTMDKRRANEIGLTYWTTLDIEQQLEFNIKQLKRILAQVRKERMMRGE